MSRQQTAYEHAWEICAAYRYRDFADLDAVGSKVCALAGRHTPRDFIDVAAALSRYTVAELIDLARSTDPGLSDKDFADAGRRLDRINDQAFTRYGLTPADITELRTRMAAWPRP